MAKRGFNLFFYRVFIAIRFIQLVSKLLVDISHFDAFIFSFDLEVICEPEVLSFELGVHFFFFYFSLGLVLDVGLFCLLLWRLHSLYSVFLLALNSKLVLFTFWHWTMFAWWFFNNRAYVGAGNSTVGVRGILLVFIISGFISWFSSFRRLFLFVLLLDSLDFFFSLCKFLVSLILFQPSLTWFEIPFCSVLWDIFAFQLTPWSKGTEGVCVFVWCQFLEFTTWSLWVNLLEFFNDWFLMVFINVCVFFFFWFFLSAYGDIFGVRFGWDVGMTWNVIGL